MPEGGGRIWDNRSGRTRDIPPAVDFAPVLPGVRRGE